MPKLYTFYERILAVNMEKMRLDKYLSKVLGVSRSQVAHLVDKKMVLVNGKVAKKSGIFVEESDRVEIAESVNQNNPSLRADSQNLRGNPPIKKTQDLQGGWLLRNARKSFGLPRSHSLARNDENSVRVAESSLDSANLQNLPQIKRIYEDSDILVLNKPPFLATHGAPSLKEPSLVEWLKAHKIQRSTISGELREGIVHRLDKQTSGALVVAKNNASHQALSAQLSDKTMTRLYLAIIDLPLKEDIEIECYLARNPKNRLKISKVDVRKIRRFAESSAKNPSLRADSQNLRGKPPCDSAILSQGRWLLRNARKSFGLPRSHLLARNDEFATDSQNLPKFARYSKSKFYKLLPSIDGKKELILARLFTGRTHQIRAHLESINRHIIGDELYGYKCGKGENYRVMLHAYLLELKHPKNTRIFDLDSAEPQNLNKKIPSLRDSAKQNRGNPQDLQAKRSNHPPIKKMQDLQDRLPREQSSLAMTENKEIAESNADSANLRFIAPLFDDMQDYLAKNFDMEKVNEILRTLPARAF